MSSDSWSSVLVKARKSVVQIRTTTAKHFDGNHAGPSIGTGFVVDKKLGIIMTNRHVISTAPVSLEVAFLNDEEVVAEPIYIDPLHDFGFCKIDPSKVKYMEFGELALNPKGAKPGVEVRVLGCDAGEKTMILQGTISRTDRNPPEYEPGSGFTDHNIFYITAACDTSGGSSGSPVLDKNCTVVALNAGAAMDAASSFFLPLDRGVKALNVIRSCLSKGEYCIWKSLPRGTLQCVFGYTSMPECNRRGVSQREEAEIRKSLEVGTHLLVVEATIPDGPADRAGLMCGDVLLKVNGRYLNQFSELEELLDEAMADENKQRALTFEFKRGAERMEIKTMAVSNAYDAIPDAFLSFGHAIVHRIGYSTALDYRLPMASVIVQAPGYTLEMAGAMSDSVFVSVDNIAIKSLDDLQRVLSERKHDEIVLARLIHAQNKHSDVQVVITVDRKWFTMTMCRRDPSRFGRWVYEDSTLESLTDSESASRLSSTSNTGGLLARPASFRILKANDYSSAEERIFRSMVVVTFDTPFPLDGKQGMSYLGTGYIVSKEHGLVVTDRNTVISLLGNVRVEIGFTYILPAKVVYLHPFQNIAIIQFDTSQLGETQVEQLELFDAAENPVERDLKQGEQLAYFGFTNNRRMIHIPDQVVVGFERANVLTSMTPRFAAKNIDQVKFERLIPAGSIGGVYVDSQGRGRCLCTSYSVAEDEDEVYMNALISPTTQAVKTVVNAIEQGKDPRDLEYFSLACEFGTMELSIARSGMKLPLAWVEKMRQAADTDTSGAGTGTREVLKVFAIMAGTPPAEQLRIGDLILAADGVSLVSYNGFEIKANHAGAEGRPLQVTLLRKGEVMEIPVTLAKFSCSGTKRLVSFCGFACQDTHDAVRFLSFMPPYLLKDPQHRRGVYISSLRSGSPAHRSGLPPTRWITEIQETPVYDLDDLLRLAKAFKHGEIVRVRTLGIAGDEAVTTHALDLHHFPTFEIVYKKGSTHEASMDNASEWEVIIHAREMTNI